MLRWLGNALASSIGKKTVMGLTGLLLVGFLVMHLSGNLSLYADGDGTAFNAYVVYLKGFGPLLYVAELGLLALFASHIYLAFRLTLENREARKDRYVVRADRGAKTVGSASMFVTGAIVLAFLIKHLLDFRFDGAFEEDPAALVKDRLAHPGNAVAYIVAALVVGLHVSHGLRSAFQSLGANHPKWNGLLVIAGWVAAVVFGLGFASFPLVYLLSA